MAIDPRPPTHRSHLQRPPVPRSGALAALALAAALAGPFALTACGGAAGPASRPGAAAPAESDVPEAAPVNASPEATAEAPATAAPTPPPVTAAPRTPPPPPEVEPRSEWTIDESIETPYELKGREILAKFKKGEDVVIIYRAENGDLYRRVQGRLGSYTRVEESRIEPEP